MTDRLPIFLPAGGLQEEMSSGNGDKIPRALVYSGIGVVHATASSNNVDIAIDIHTVIDVAAQGDTVTLPSADTSGSVSVGDVLEVYNDSGAELVLSKQVADLYEGSPSTVIPDQTAFHAKITDDLTWEVIGTGAITDFVSGITHILSTERFKIPVRREMVVSSLDLDGALTIDGQLTVI